MHILSFLWLLLARPSEGCIAPRLGYGAALGCRSRADAAALCAIPSLCSLAIGVAQSRGRTPPRPQELLFIAQLQQKKEPECGRVHEGLGLKREGKIGKGGKKKKNEVYQSPELHPDPLPGGSRCCCAQSRLRVGCNSAAVPWTAGQPRALCCTFFSSLHLKPKSSRISSGERRLRCSIATAADPLLLQMALLQSHHFCGIPAFLPALSCNRCPSTTRPGRSRCASMW